MDARYNTRHLAMRLRLADPGGAVILDPSMDGSVTTTRNRTMPSIPAGGIDAAAAS
jgi:hypothetical protein